jgi:hypothetical protein
VGPSSVEVGRLAGAEGSGRGEWWPPSNDAKNAIR